MTTYFGASELPAMFAAVGVVVAVGGVTGLGIVDRDDQTLLQGDVVGVPGKVILVRVITGAFPALAVDVDATVDGVTYVVREVLQGSGEPDDDGAVSRFRCEVKP